MLGKYKKAVLLSRKSCSCTYELPIIVAACSRLMEAQMRQNTIIKVGRWLQRLAEELQVANQDGELLFFKGVVLGKWNTVQWMITYLRVYRQKKLDFMDLKKMSQDKNCVTVRMILRENGERTSIIKTHGAPYLNNYRQLRNADSGSNSCPQRRGFIWLPITLWQP